MNFQVGGSTGSGFCRIGIPQVLIAAPFVVAVDGAPLSYSVVLTNGTYTWIYFDYSSSAHDLMISAYVPPGVPVWSVWWFWGMSGLAVVGLVLGGFTVKFRRRVIEQARVLQAYKGPFMVAEALFNADIERRGMKIKEFEAKYGVRIQPRSTLEDVLKSLETRKKEEES
jgi:hypothetical protein